MIGSYPACVGANHALKVPSVKGMACTLPVQSKCLLHTNPPCKEWSVRQGLYQAREGEFQSPKSPVLGMEACICLCLDLKKLSF